MPGGQPPRAEPAAQRGGWGGASKGRKRETEATTGAAELGLHPPHSQAPGAGGPQTSPAPPSSAHPACRIGHGRDWGTDQRLCLPPEKRSGSLRRLGRKPRRSRTRTRALAPSPLWPPRAPLRPGSSPPQPCPSASVRANPVAWNAQRRSRVQTSQSPNCPRQRPLRCP